MKEKWCVNSGGGAISEEIGSGVDGGRRKEEEGKTIENLQKCSSRT